LFPPEHKRIVARQGVDVSGGVFCGEQPATVDGATVTCLVRDDGAGIPPEMLGKVFDKRATDPAHKGKGLGLTIVKQIMEAHGGTVKAESTRGAGATFSFTIPAAP
jgi:signal transduction histidine kinase